MRQEAHAASLARRRVRLHRARSSSGTAPVRDAYRQGAAQGYRDAQPSSGPGQPGALATGTAQPDAPAWAQSLARRQRTTQAGLVAAQALREGDRPASGAGPDLKDKS